MRLLVVLAVALGVASCAPMYGGKAEKMANPPKKKKPPEAEAAPVEIKYVEDCNANFSDDPSKARPQPAKAKVLFDQGELALDQADKAQDDKKKVDSLKDAIEKYRSALIQDPYNVSATLKLAVAYDRVLRKGCAIAMLKRLAALADSPRWGSEAKRHIDSIDANAGWFKGYRKDALAAVGR